VAASEGRWGCPTIDVNMGSRLDRAASSIAIERRRSSGWEGASSTGSPRPLRSSSDPIPHSPSTHPPSLRGGFPHPQPPASPAVSEESRRERLGQDTPKGPSSVLSHITWSRVLFPGNAGSTRPPAKRCPSGRIVPLAFDTSSPEGSMVLPSTGSSRTPPPPKAGWFGWLTGTNETEAWKAFDPNRGEPFERDPNVKVRERFWSTFLLVGPSDLLRAVTIQRVGRRGCASHLLR